MIDNLEGVNYLCADCAIKKGLEWRFPGHGATMHVDNCDICGEEKTLACINDYKDANGKLIGEWD